MYFLMNVLITGQRGFIGKNIYTRFLQKSKIKKIFFKNYTKLSLKKFENKIEKIIFKFKPDLVIHTATYFSNKRGFSEEKKCMKINYIYSKKFFEICEKNFVKKFVYFGSAHEYEKIKKKLYPYLLSKKKFTNYISKRKKFTKILGIYLFNTFGDNDKRNKFYSKLIKKPNEKLLFYEKLKLNFINVSSLTKYIFTICNKNWNFTNRKICICNDKFIKIFELSKIKNINILLYKKNKYNIEEDKIILPFQRIFLKGNSNNLINYLKIALKPNFKKT